MKVKKLILPVFIAFVSIIIVSAAAFASTSISTSISTGGSLTLSSLASSGSPCLAINNIGLVSTTTCGGGGTPAGASSTIQFNASGAFAANPGLTFNGTTLTAPNLSIPTGGTISWGGSTLIDSSGNLNATVIPLQDTASNLASVVPSSGQAVYETDTKLSFVGDGTHSITNLLPVGFWRGDSTQISFNGSTGIGIGTTTTDQSAFTLIHGARINSGQRVMLGIDGDPISGSYLGSGSGDTALYTDVSSGSTYNGKGAVFLSVDDQNVGLTIGVASPDSNAVNFFNGPVGIGSLNDGSTAIFEVTGTMRAAQTSTSTATCNSSTQEGVFFYNKENHHFWGCNGSVWKQLD